MRGLRIGFPYLLFGLMAVAVTMPHLRSRDALRPHGESAARIEVDLVCRMEVSPAWGIFAVHEGTEYAFCNVRCREQFVAEPARFVGRTCMVCRDPIPAAAALPATYLEETYWVCNEAHRETFKADPAGFFMHRMWGIPAWMYYASIALILIVSFFMFEGLTAFRRNPKGDHSAEHEPPSQNRSCLAQDGCHGQAEPRNEAELARASARNDHGQASLPMAPMMMNSSALRERSCSAGTRALTPLGAAGTVAATLPLPLPTLTARSASRRTERPDRIDLMRWAPVRWALCSRSFRFGVQLTMVAFFVLIIAAGLFGNQNASLNIAPILTWTIWWGGLVVLIMFAGKAWCYMCPWEALANWAERLRFWKKTDTGATLGLRWPRVVRNISIATILFIGLTWIELGFGVTMKPRITAYLALGMLALAIVSAFLFDRKSFCRYGCLVGRVSGLYALFSGIEVRSRSQDVCQACRTKECVKGSETAYGCPTFEYPGKMQTNTYCIQCTECLQACPEDNLAVNLRPWGSDLAVDAKPRRDEAYLALIMLALTGFHGLTMTPVWRTLTASIESTLPFGRIFAFTIGMTVLMIVPIAFYAALVWLSHAITLRGTARSATPSTREISYHDYFVRYAYCVLPIALFYHLAHNLEHLLMEGQKVVALISDPFGWGWNLFGTARWVVPPLVSLDVLWILQIVLVGVGHVYSLWAAQKISRRLYADPTAASRGQLPMLVAMIAFSVMSLWLLKQPMEMRTSAM